MYWLLFFPTLIISAWIAYEDFRHRAVTWMLFPALMISGFLLSFFLSRSYELTLKYSVYNMLFLFFQFILLKVYFLIRHRDNKIINRKIGIGDILFLAASCFYFSPLNFVFFYISSLLFSLIAYALFFRKKNQSSLEAIPLAGLQSLFLIVFITLNKALANNMSTDAWILFKLNIG